MSQDPYFAQPSALTRARAQSAGLNVPKRALVPVASKPPDNLLLTLEVQTSAGLDEVVPWYWTEEDAFEGTQIFGETGSGKTSGSGAAIATAFLKRKFGGLVLTAKVDDIDNWLHPLTGYLAAIPENERPEVFVFGQVAPRYSVTDGVCTVERPTDINTTRAFNFLDYEFEKSGQGTFNLVQLFITALESGSQNTGHDDAYWLEALRQLLTNAIELAYLATDAVRLEDIQAIIQTAPQSREEAQSHLWQQKKNTCWQFLDIAQKRITEKTSRNFNQIADYWLRDFAGLADRTRSVIVSTFTSKVTGLTRSPLFELLCTGTCKPLSDEDKKKGLTNPFIDLVDLSRRGALAILNLPVKRFSEVGRFAQVLIKTVWQRAIERDPKGGKPVFLWADESQFFATKEDMLFQTTARSARCATVYLTQNINNYYAMVPGRDPKSTTESLLGNLTTKIFHANSDPITNEWAQRLFGNERQTLGSQATTTDGDSKTSVSTTRAEALPAPIVHARDFSMLRRGGAQQERNVDAIIFKSGVRLQEGGVTVMRTTFKQMFATGRGPHPSRPAPRD